MTKKITYIQLDREYEYESLKFLSVVMHRQDSEGNTSSISSISVTSYIPTRPTCYVTHSFGGVVAATGRGISGIARVQIPDIVSVANYARVAVAKVVSIAV